MLKRLALALAVPALAASSRPPASDPAPGTLAVAICTPEHIYAVKDRAHIRCFESAGGILFFAAPLSDKAHSTQVVHKGFQALASGGKLRIEYDPADQSGAAWGCLAHDCRPAVSIQPQKQ